MPVFDTSVRYDLPLTSKTLAALVHVYISGRMVDGAFSVIESFKDLHQVLPDYYCCRAMIREHIRAIIAPEKAELDRIRNSSWWNPDPDTTEKLRKWGMSVVRRPCGVKALEYLLSKPATALSPPGVPDDAGKDQPGSDSMVLHA